MMSKRFQIFFLIHILYTLFHLDSISCILTRSNSPPTKYCGPNLSDILEDLCIEYKIPTEFKRSNSIGNGYLLTKHDGSPFLNQKYALSSMFRRTRRDYVITAHDECCENKGCTISELLQYCRIPKYRVVEQ